MATALAAAPAAPTTATATATAAKNGTVRRRRLDGGRATYVWLQPTTVVDAHLVTADKQKYMTEDIIATYRKVRGG